MSNRKSTQVSRRNKISNQIWILSLGSALVTLYFNSRIQDPFNSPKMWLLMLLASILLGYLVTDLKNLSNDPTLRKITFLGCAFAAAGVFAVIFTDSKYSALFGENQRRNGFLSYLSLTVLIIAASLYIRIESVKHISYVAFITGLLLGTYGLMQNAGQDFVQWNNPYNSIISTVGNPNFAGAIMAMMASIIFGPVLNKQFNPFYRIMSLLLTLLLLRTIYLSGAKQGLISLALGVGVYILIWIYQQNKKLGNVFAVLGTVIGIMSVLGMLKIGPLTSIMYKGSVSVRGYYWRTGIKMFTENPITGVGIDRYGAYFKEYRESGYPLNYGFDITSSNAHNTPIQFFATGGLFLGLTYLALTAFIFIRGIKALLNHKGTNQLLVAGIFSAWLAYEAQSIISIDNIGISVWGWLLGGAVVGVSLNNGNSENLTSDKRKNSNSSYLQPVFAMGFLIFAIVFVSILYKGESNMYQTRMRYNPQIAAGKAEFHDYAFKTITTPLVEPNYKIITASYLAQNGFLSEGIQYLKETSSKDPRNLDALIYLAEFSERSQLLDDAILYREKIAALDPFNTRNYLQLGREYKAKGNYSKVSQILSKINSYDQVSAESKSANVELAIP
jgi:O-antigen ligase